MLLRPSADGLGLKTAVKYWGDDSTVHGLLIVKKCLLMIIQTFSSVFHVKNS